MSLAHTLLHKGQSPTASQIVLRNKVLLLRPSLAVLTSAAPRCAWATYCCIAELRLHIQPTPQPPTLRRLPVRFQDLL